MASPQKEQQPLSLEADFTRHVLSLFGSLFDYRAAPYIGPIPPDDIQPEEEEEDTYEPPPPFSSSLCDFRLRASYKQDVDSHPALIDELTAKGETIIENTKNPESQTIILGERLAARSMSGKTTETELKMKRNEALEKSRQAASARRKKFIDARKNATMELAQREREDYKELMREFEKMKKAEMKQRQAFAEVRREAMVKRREEQLKKRAIEIRKQEEARRTVENVTYRSQMFPTANTQNIETLDREARQEMMRSVKTRREIGQRINQRNKETIKPKQRLNDRILSP
ncbi:inner centromere protein [Tritrichomonas foetus]|uniref:Inner centromere protein n=1 Tax=Tritrichomonas foetus TaxID=1144522 RepID=A0A1J4KKX6_9EUKA|nr:inner centromere protein [Tritrichomonas foetus]|eukprot:OHT11592.1 inner centromere protein [Tritrichomonas foetus]